MGLASLNNELHYIGKTYYENYAGYWHRTNLLKRILGIPVNKTELFFNDDSLIAISFFLEEKALLRGHIIECLASYFSHKGQNVIRNVIEALDDEIDVWEDNQHFIGLLSVYSNNGLIVHVVTKEHCFLF